MREVKTGMYNADSFSVRDEEAKGAARAKARQERLAKKAKMSGPDHITQESDLDTVEASDTYLVVAEISDIVDRYAMTLAKQKALEYWKSKSALNPQKWLARQTSAAFEQKLAAEIKEEILKNQNLFTQIEARLLSRSKTKNIEEKSKITYDVLDEVIDGLQDEQFKALGIESKSQKELEGKSPIEDPLVDVAASQLIYGLVVGDIVSRKEFEERAGKEILPLLSMGSKKSNEVYASSLYNIALNYKERLIDVLGVVGEKFDAKQQDLARKYIDKNLHLKIHIAKQNADIYQKESKGKIKLIESAINISQNPIFQVKPEWENNKYGKFANKVLGMTLNNPILYAALGNRAGYFAATGAGALAVKAGGATMLAAVSIGPGMAAALGAALGAGLYIGLRAAVERLRDIKRREEEAVLGQRNKEVTSLMDAREYAINFLKQLDGKQHLTDEEKKQAAYIFATLRTQDEYRKNLFSVSDVEGARTGTNFFAIQDLRKELLVFWDKNAQHFGADAESQRESLENMISAAQLEILKKLEQDDKDIAKEIKNRGLKQGALGAGITLAAGVLAPGAGKLLKMGANKTMEALGFSPQFDTSKITFTEEIGHKIAERFGKEHYDVYSGALAGIKLTGPNGDLLQLPYGSSIRRVNNYFELLLDGKPVPGVKIPVDVQGHITDPSSLEGLEKFGWKIDHQVISGSGTKNVDLFKDVKSEALNGVDFSEVKTRSFLTNGTQESDFNELRFFAEKASNGDAIISTDILDKGSFYANGKGPAMLDMLKVGKLRFFFMTKEGPLSFAMDGSQHLTIPQGSKAYELLIDSSTGKIRSDVMFGSGVAEKNAAGEWMVDWANADHGTGAALNTNVSSVSTNVWSLRQPVSHEFGGPAIFALMPRDTDSDIEIERKLNAQKDAEKKMKSLSSETRFQMAQDLYLKEFGDKKPTLAEVKFIQQKFLLDEHQAELIFIEMLKDDGMDPEEIKTATKPKTPTPAPAAPASGGHGHDHTPTPQAHAPVSHEHEPTKLEILLGLRKKQVAEKLKPKADRSVLLELSKIVLVPHLEFQTEEDALLVAPKLLETNELAVAIGRKILDMNLDKKYKNINILVKFVTAKSPEAPKKTDDGTLVIELDARKSPEFCKNVIAEFLRNTVEKDGPLVFQTEADRKPYEASKKLEAVSNRAENTDPHFEFSLKPEALKHRTPEELEEYANAIFAALQANPATQQGAKPGKNIEIIFGNYDPRKGPEAAADKTFQVYIDVTKSKREAEGLVIRLVKDKLEEGEKEAEIENLLREFNQAADNKEPHIIFDIDSKTKKDANIAEMRIYLQWALLAVRNEITAIKAANPDYNDIFNMRIFGLNLNSNRTNNPRLVDNDPSGASWILNIPYGLADEAPLRAFVNQQITALKRQYDQRIAAGAGGRGGGARRAGRGGRP